MTIKFPEIGRGAYEEMIQAQRNLQVALGHDHARMTYEQKIQYVKDNTLAAIAELMEALDECSWKPWTTGASIDEAAMFGELRDVWQFLTNLMLVVEHDPDELANRLRIELYAKHAVNYQRIADGYDGRSTKCPTCKRALDDDDVHCEVSTHGHYCAKEEITHINEPNFVRDSSGVPNVKRRCPICHSSLDPEDTGFRAPELICDGTEAGCRMSDDA